jgi:transposase
MSEKAKEILEVETLTNLADKGYYDGQDIAACEAAGVICMVAKPKHGGVKKEEGFTRKDFEYEREHDCYMCPGKNQMLYMRNQKHSDGKIYRIYADYAACGKCPRKGECTKGEYRQILRPLYQDTVDIVDERTRNNKGLYRKRQEIAEHPFGTIKAVWGYRQFLCRTKPKVCAEVSLAYLAYNMRRVINIFTGKRKNPAVLLGQTA